MDDEGLTGKQKSIIAGAVIIGISATILWATEKNKHHKKQRAVEEYLEHIGMVEAAKHRLLEIFHDPTKSEDEFLDAVKIEKAWLCSESDSQ